MDEVFCQGGPRSDACLAFTLGMDQNELAFELQTPCDYCVDWTPQSVQPLVAAAIPEPSIVLCLGTGIVILAILRTLRQIPWIT